MSTGLLSEHQPTEPGTANSGKEPLNLPEQPPEERKDVKMVMHLLNKSKAHRAKYDRDWANNYKFFRGDQWANKRPSYRHSEVINFIFQHIQSSVPIMTDTRPRPSFLPRDPADLQVAEILDDLFDADWQHGNWMYKLAEVIYDSYFYGHGLSRLYFDKSEDFGLGRIQFRSFEPFDAYPDPDANDINEGEEFSSFFITACPQDVEKVRLKYRGHRYEAAIQADMEEPRNLFTKSSLSKRAFVRPTDKDLPIVREMSDKEAGADEQSKVLVITAYLKPQEVMQEEQTVQDDEGNDKVEFITKKKYPNGRRIVIINGYVFEDEPHLPNDDGKFPFQKHVNYILPREFYGISEIEQLASPQRIFNKMVSFALDVLTLMGNPIWLIPNSSGVDPEALHNAPGMRVPFDGDAAPQRVEGAQLQPYVVQMIDRMEQWFNGISGSQDITRGINPPSVTAASAIENLQAAAQTRLRQKMRQLDGYLTQVGEQYAQLVFQNYTQSRVFRLTNKDGVEKFFRFHVEPAQDPDGLPLTDSRGDPVRQAVVSEFTEDQDLGRLVETPAKRFLIRGQFDVKVNTQTGLPFSKAEQEQRLLQLYDRTIIDRRAVLEKLEFPNFEPILQRIQEQEQAQLQAAQQAQAGG